MELTRLGDGSDKSGDRSYVSVSEDAWMRIPEGELIYDFVWYPYMSLSNPQTCCVAATCRV